MQPKTLWKVLLLSTVIVGIAVWQGHVLPLHADV